MLKLIDKAIHHPDKIIENLGKRHLLNWVPDEWYLKVLYWLIFKKKLDLDNPTTFNEKVQWLKIHDRQPKYTTMVDKCEAKRYIANKIGEAYIIPNLGVWENFDEIDFDMLPDQFVLKCTHDSGGIVICKDKSKFDVKDAKKKINRCLNCNFYWYGREWPYKNVKPRILAEKYITDESGIELKDYKFMCFNGQVKCIFTVTERFSDAGLKVTFFDRDWNLLPFERHYPKSSKSIPRPFNLEKMIELAEILSKDIQFVRVDFYESNEKILFGELTFYPGGGFEEFNPEKWDYVLGSWLNLDCK